MYSVTDLENIFKRNKVGYWTIQDSRSNVANTSADFIDIQDSEKQYADFLEALEDLKEDTYKVNLFTSQKASASKKVFQFIKGEPAAKMGNTSRDTGMNMGGGNIMMMFMKMMQDSADRQRESDKRQTDFMMMMMKSQVENKDVLMEKSLAHQEAIHKAQMELEKTKLAANKSNVDKMIGAVTNPHFAKVISAFQGQPVAVGTAAAAAGDEVDVPVESAQTPPSVSQPVNEPNKRLFELLTRIKGHFPGLNPLDTIEVLLMKLDEDPSVKEKLLS